MIFNSQVIFDICCISVLNIGQRFFMDVPQVGIFH